MLGQDWKLNQCSDFITLCGDRAYFIALLIYSNKCPLQQPNENAPAPSPRRPPLHGLACNGKRREGSCLGEDKSEFLELEGADNALVVQV